MTAVEIAVSELGGAPDAPSVVLGPSLGTSTILWEDVAPRLAAHYRVLAWDLPGHGRSPDAAGPFSVADLADAVAGAVPEGELRYAGVSLGGAVGLELALRHPQRLRAAAIIASGAVLGDPGGWHDRSAQVRAQGTSSLVIASAQRWFADGSVARRPDLSGRLLHALRDADGESYARCCEALAAYDVRDRLAEVAAPILAVWGEHDAVAPEAKSAEIAAGVPHGRSIRIADAAHLPPAEQPDAVADALLDFFGSVEGTSR